MSGGWGGGSWGGGAFGGSSSGSVAYTNTVTETITISESLTLVVNYIPATAETISFNEALNVVGPLNLVGAVPISPFVVEVTFSHDIDPLFAANFSPSNYILDPTIPPLVIENVVQAASNAVFLITEEQDAFIYTLTVVTARSAPGDLLSPPNQTTTFPGFAIVPQFYAVAQSRRKVMLVFSSTMDQGPHTGTAFTNPANYSIRDLQGNLVPIVSVAPQGPSPESRATIILGADLTPGGYYVAHVGPAVKSTSDLSVAPPDSLFQWHTMEAPITTGPIVIPFSSFSGEVTTGLLGQPAGQLFFSPAFEHEAENSIIQIDEVSLCTRAFDAYSFPQPVDPPALFTFSPTAPAGVLGPTSVLWSSAERQGLPRITLSNSHTDTLPDPTDSRCHATLVEPIDITKASFLNDSRWKLFPGTLNFKTASNLSPIGPGPTTNITLEP